MGNFMVHILHLILLDLLNEENEIMIELVPLLLRVRDISYRRSAIQPEVSRGFPVP
jgi:hypothetical protein